jgi:hypothetical protein
MKTSILDSARNLNLAITVWINPRGIFLTVFPDDNDEVELVDAKKFATMDALEFFIRENLNEWKDATEKH